jgi:hypothetical protein
LYYVSHSTECFSIGKPNLLMLFRQNSPGFFPKNHIEKHNKPLEQHTELCNVKTDGIFSNSCALKFSPLEGLSNLSKPQLYQILLYTLIFRDWIFYSAASKLQIVRFIFYLYIMQYQSIIFHLRYPYDLFASHFQTYAYVLIRWSDYWGM